MKKSTFILFIAILLICVVSIYLIYNDLRLIGCTKEIRACSDGTGVGRNPDNNCEFDECPGQSNLCTPESRNIEACDELYRPVCGWFNPAKINCIDYPCAQTFSNRCFACQDEDVLHWTEGKCPS